MFESRCSLDTSYYPFDSQSCGISFVVWSYSVAQVEIFKSKQGIIIADGFEANSVWDITSVSYDVSKETRESKITFTFKLKRKPLYYVVNIILPVVFLGLLNGLVFIIPAETGEKSGYSVTVFLSLAVFLTIISTLLPVNSEKVSIFGIYLLLQVVIGVFVLFVSTIQLRLNCRSPSRPVTGIFLRIAKFGCCKNSLRCTVKRNNDVVSLPEKRPPSEQVLADVEDNDHYSWSDVVSSLDFIGFWCFVAVYLIITIVIFSILMSG